MQGRLLCSRWTRTEAMMMTVQQTYNELLSSLSGLYCVFWPTYCIMPSTGTNAVSIDEDLILRWIEADKATLLSDTSSASKLPQDDWRTMYYQLLHMYYSCVR